MCAPFFSSAKIMFFDEYERVIKELKTNICSLDLNMEFENINGRLESSIGDFSLC